MKNNDVIAENHFQTPVAYPKGEEGAGAPYEVAPMGPTKNEHWICRSNVAGLPVKLQLIGPYPAS